MAFENLLRSVEESAQEKERELREKARITAELIRSEAKSRAKDIEQTYIADAKRSAETERNKELFLTRGELRALQTRTRQGVFQAAFAEARRQLSGVRQDPEYPAIFAHLAREAIHAIGPEKGTFRIHTDPRDEDLCRNVTAALKFPCEIVADLSSMGGLVVSSPDEEVIVSNTFESRLLRAEEHRQLELYAILRGD
jgi:V/A-type H+/Na+-transporting ATPase subunit E